MRAYPEAQPPDLDDIYNTFLGECRDHQIGPIEDACACRRNNPRPAIGDLLAEVDRLRAALAEAADNLDGQAKTCREYGDATTMRTLATQLRRVVQ